MALDGIVLNKIVDNLDKQTPIRINKIYSLGKNELIFNVRTGNKSARLLISGDSNQNRIHFTDRSYMHDNEPTNFVMLLRKHLLNGQIIKIEQYNYDRIIRIDIENYNSIGDKVLAHLYLELMGRYANIIFTDSGNIIYDAVKRISPLENPNQVIVPGAKYIFNYDNTKKDIFKAKTYNLNESLVDQFSGVSPTLEKEIQYRIKSLNESFDDIIKLIKNSNELVISSQDNSSDFHIIELKHKYNSFKHSTFDEGFDLYYYDKSQQERIKQSTHDLLKFLRKEHKKQSKKLIKLNQELEFNQNSSMNLKYGDLITTYQYNIKKGMPYVNLIDYDTEQEVSIVLDEKLSPIENAQKYYKKYRKQSNSLKHLSEQISHANNEILYFELLIEQLSYADINSATEIRQELIDKKYIYDKSKYKKVKKKAKPNFTSINYNGTQIKIGKNNIQNDYLTKNSSRNAFWFHVQSYHGSHVIVESDTLEEDTIIFAATLATYFSKARNSSNVEVNYTQIKNIKRTNVKGLVQLKEYKTVLIENNFTTIKDYI